MPSQSLKWWWGFEADLEGEFTQSKPSPVPTEYARVLGGKTATARGKQNEPQTPKSLNHPTRTEKVSVLEMWHKGMNPKEARRTDTLSINPMSLQAAGFQTHSSFFGRSNRVIWSPLTMWSYTFCSGNIVKVMGMSRNCPCNAKAVRSGNRPDALCFLQGRCSTSFLTAPRLIWWTPHSSSPAKLAVRAI